MEQPTGTTIVTADQGVTMNWGAIFGGWLIATGMMTLLYLGGRADAGLSQSVELTAGGLVIGVLLGVVVTRLYDRRGYHRVSTAPMADTPDGVGDPPETEFPYPEQ